jgi:hypothetical protein
MAPRDRRKLHRGQILDPWHQSEHQAGKLHGKQLTFFSSVATSLSSPCLALWPRHRRRCSWSVRCRAPGRPNTAPVLVALVLILLVLVGA